MSYCNERVSREDAQLVDPKWRSLRLVVVHVVWPMIPVSIRRSLSPEEVKVEVLVERHRRWDPSSRRSARRIGGGRTPRATRGGAKPLPTLVRRVVNHIHPSAQWTP